MPKSDSKNATKTPQEMEMQEYHPKGEGLGKPDVETVVVQTEIEEEVWAPPQVFIEDGFLSICKGLQVHGLDIANNMVLYAEAIEVEKLWKAGDPVLAWKQLFALIEGYVGVPLRVS